MKKRGACSATTSPRRSSSTSRGDSGGNTVPATVSVRPSMVRTVMSRSSSSETWWTIASRVGASSKCGEIKLAT